MSVLHTILLLLCVGVLGLHAQIHDPRYLHEAATILDGHNDLLHAVTRGFVWDRPQSTGSADLFRLRDAGVDIQVLSLYAYPVPGQQERAWQTVLQQCDSLDALVARWPDRIAVPATLDEMDRHLASGRLVVLPALEGAFGVNGSLDRLRFLARRGLRLIGPTWNETNAFAGSAVNEDANQGRSGLTPLGRRMVALCDSAGIVLDASHLGSNSLRDLLATTRNPILASHSNCRALRDHPRNLTDNEIRAIAAADGVVMVTFVPGFLAGGGESVINRMRPYQAELARLRPVAGPYSDNTLLAMESVIRRADEAGLITVSTVLAHVRHIDSLVGTRYIGIGSDFGALEQTPVGLTDIRDLQLLTRALVRGGYGEDAIRGILGGNALRVVRAVWERKRGVR